MWICGYATMQLCNYMVMWLYNYMVIRLWGYAGLRLIYLEIYSTLLVSLHHATHPLLHSSSSLQSSLLPITLPFYHVPSHLCSRAVRDLPNMSTPLLPQAWPQLWAHLGVDSFSPSIHLAATLIPPWFASVLHFSCLFHALFQPRLCLNPDFFPLCSFLILPRSLLIPSFISTSVPASVPLEYRLIPASYLTFYFCSSSFSPHHILYELLILASIQFRRCLILATFSSLRLPHFSFPPRLLPHSHLNNPLTYHMSGHTLSIPN